MSRKETYQCTCKHIRLSNPKMINYLDDDNKLVQKKKHICSVCNKIIETEKLTINVN